MIQGTRIEIHPYKLIPRAVLGCRAGGLGPRNGALLKLTFEEGICGYGDCFPWPELGDLPLEEQLALMQQDRLTSLTRCSFYFAKEDAVARANRKSLFEGLTPPPNHFLLTHLEGLEDSFLHSLASQNIRLLKLKVGLNPLQEARKIRSVVRSLRELSMHLRLDFNGALSSSQLDEFLSEIEDGVERIDFLEDPVPYEPLRWKEIQRKWKVRLALDRLPSHFEDPDHLGDLGSFSVCVLKPAIQALSLKSFFGEEGFGSSGIPIVVTSYLDHPVGQSFAAWMAAKLRMKDPFALAPGGLNSHFAYEETPFSKALSKEAGTPSPFFTPSAGFGIGFDDLLTSLEWSELKN